MKVHIEGVKARAYDAEVPVMLCNFRWREDK